MLNTLKRKITEAVPALVPSIASLHAKRQTAAQAVEEARQALGAATLAAEEGAPGADAARARKALQAAQERLADIDAAITAAQAREADASARAVADAESAHKRAIAQDIDAAHAAVRLFPAALDALVNVVDEIVAARAKLQQYGLHDSPSATALFMHIHAAINWKLRDVAGAHVPAFYSDERCDLTQYLPARRSEA